MTREDFPWVGKVHRYYLAWWNHSKKEKKGHDQPLAISIKMMERREGKISDWSGGWMIINFDVYIALWLKRGGERDRWSVSIIIRREEEEEKKQDLCFNINLPTSA